jgi:hypothetical protein
MTDASLTVSCFVLLCAGAFVFALVASPSMRRTEAEDLKRTGCAFHGFAWLLATIIGVSLFVGVMMILQTLIDSAVGGTWP